MNERERKINELQEKIQYEEKQLNIAGYQTSDLLYFYSLKKELQDLLDDKRYAIGKTEEIAEKIKIREKYELLAKRNVYEE